MWLVKAHTSQETATSISGSSSFIASGSRQIMKKLLPVFFSIFNIFYSFDY